jgi:hypothetical protein
MSTIASRGARRAVVVASVLLGSATILVACSKPTPKPSPASFEPGPNYTTVPINESGYPPPYLATKVPPYPGAGEEGAQPITDTMGITDTGAITNTESMTDTGG